MINFPQMTATATALATSLRINNYTRATTSLDGFTSVIVGLGMALLTITMLNALFNLASCSHDNRSFEDIVASRTVAVIHRAKTLNILVNSLYIIEHPDADIFAKAVSVLNVTYEDVEVNEWILRALVVLDANLTNRIDSIKSASGSYFEEYLASEYEEASSEEDVSEEETSNEESSSEPPSNTHSDIDADNQESTNTSLDESEDQAPRVSRAETYYSGSGESGLGESSENNESSASSNPLTPPNTETSGDSVGSNDAINDTKESNTISEEQA